MTVSVTFDLSPEELQFVTEQAAKHGVPAEEYLAIVARGAAMLTIEGSMAKLKTQKESGK